MIFVQLGLKCGHFRLALLDSTLPKHRGQQGGLGGIQWELPFPLKNLPHTCLFAGRSLPTLNTGPCRQSPCPHPPLPTQFRMAFALPPASVCAVHHGLHAGVDWRWPAPHASGLLQHQLWSPPLSGGRPAFYSYSGPHPLSPSYPSSCPWH